MSAIQIKPRMAESAIGRIDTGVLEAFEVENGKPPRRVAFASKLPADSDVFYTAKHLSDAKKKEVAKAFAANRKTKPDAIVVEETPEALNDGPKEGDK